MVHAFPPNNFTLKFLLHLKTITRAQDTVMFVHQNTDMVKDWKPTKYGGAHL
jgi:hypothetical protein